MATNNPNSLGNLRPIESADISKLNIDQTRTAIVLTAEGTISTRILTELMRNDPVMGLRQIEALALLIPDLPSMLRSANNLDSTFTLQQLQENYPVLTKRIMGVQVWGWLSEKPLLKEALIEKKKTLSKGSSPVPNDSTILLSMLSDLTNIKKVIRENDTDIVVEAHETCTGILDILYDPDSQIYKQSDPKELIPDRENLGNIARKLLTIRRVLNKTDEQTERKINPDEVVDRESLFTAKVEFWMVLNEMLGSDNLEASTEKVIKQTLGEMIDMLYSQYADKLPYLLNIFGNKVDSGALKKSRYLDVPGSNQMDVSEQQSFMNGGNA